MSQTHDAMKGGDFMVNTVTEQNLRDLLSLAMELNGADKLVIAKTLGYVDGVRDGKRQAEEVRASTNATTEGADDEETRT